MATSLRTLARESLLALIVSYLRTGAVSTASFTTYPNTQGVWTFTLGADLWQVTLIDETQEPLPIGVSIQFGRDAAHDSKAMPQIWRTPVRIHVRVPRDFTGESPAQELAQKIDEALHRAAGRIEITDYDSGTGVGQGTFLTWQRTERGTWEPIESSQTIEHIALQFEVEYATANL